MTQQTAERLQLALALGAGTLALLRFLNVFDIPKFAIGILAALYITLRFFMNKRN